MNDFVLNYLSLPFMGSYKDFILFHRLHYLIINILLTASKVIKIIQLEVIKAIKPCIVVTKICALPVTVYNRSHPYPPFTPIFSIPSVFRLEDYARFEDFDCVPGSGRNLAAIATF